MSAFAASAPHLRNNTSGSTAGKLQFASKKEESMNIRMTKRDLEIGKGFDELNKIAESDIRSAYGDFTERRIPSQRTTELYTAIIEAVEAHTRANEENP